MMTSKWNTLWWITAACLLAVVPMTVTAGSKSISFKEELRLGGTDDDEHIWTGTKVVLQVNSKGHMFVLDAGGYRILEFDPQGKFVKSIGKRGQGPGEFMFLTNFTILDDDTAVVHENRQALSVFSWYDKDMNFVDRKTVKPGKVLQSAIHSGDGKYLRGLFVEPISAEKMNVVIGMINAEDYKSSLRTSVHEMARSNQKKMGDPNYWTEYLSQWFALIPKGHGQLTFGPKGTIFTANTQAYEIKKLDDALKEVATISRKAKPAGMSDEEMDAMIDPIRQEVLATLPAQLAPLISKKVISGAVEKAEFVPRKQLIFGMVPMEDGGLIVITDYSPITKKIKADMFDAKGKFQGHVDLPPVIVNSFGAYFGTAVQMFFKGGKAYVLESNEDDDVILARYGYKVK